MAALNKVVSVDCAQMILRSPPPNQHLCIYSQNLSAEGRFYCLHGPVLPLMSFAHWCCVCWWS